MKMEKKKFRIGQLAQQVGVERFVIRFWEKEFGLASSRSTGGQRFYTEADLELFKQIKTLLYNEGFTISGAKKKLAETQHFIAAQVEMPKERTEKYAQKTEWCQDELLDHIVSLKRQLSKLRR